MTPDHYTRQLKHLLPPGRLLNLESGSWLSKVLLGLAGELSRISERAADQRLEYHPSTATETLEDWERVFGLPDECLTEIPSSIADRRLAILQKATTRGGQSVQFYIDLAASLGMVVTIDTFRVCRSGQARSGDRCYTDEWAYTWLVNLPIGDTDSGFRAGSIVGESLGTHGQFGIECIIQRASPAHTIVLFSYSG